MADSTFIGGVDLGQSQDPSSLCIAEVLGESPNKRYEVRWLQQWARGTSYTTITKDLCSLYSRAPLTGTVLAIDKSGVGAAVVDAIISAGFGGRLIPITITAGNRATASRGGYNVPKQDLCGAGQVVCGQRRIEVADLPLRDLLIRELLALQYKITESGHTRVEGEGTKNDDMAIALFLLLYISERHRPVSNSFRVVRTIQRTAQLRILLVSDFAALEDPNVPHVLLNLQDPLCEESPDRPGYAQLLSSAIMKCADTGPSEFGGNWQIPLQPWNKLPSELCLTREQARAVWRLLASHRIGAPVPELLIIHSIEEDRRALSIGMAIADSLNLRREEAITRIEDDNFQCKEDDIPPNKHIYDTVKSARGLVQGNICVRFASPKSRLYGTGGESIETVFPSFRRQNWRG